MSEQISNASITGDTGDNLGSSISFNTSSHSNEVAIGSFSGYFAIYQMTSDFKYVQKGNHDQIVRDDNRLVFH